MRYTHLLRRFAPMALDVRGVFALTGAFAAGFLAHGIIGTADAKPAVESPYAAMGQLGRVLALVENEYVDPVDRTRVVNGAITGMVAELDPHSAYMPPQEYKELQEENEGKFAGIGVEVELKEDAVVILSPIEGSPAAQAGLKSGDRIVAVDGQTIKEIGYDKLVRRMRGTPGTHVRIMVVREGRAEPMSIDLVRAEVQVVNVRGALMPNGVAYMHIKQFQETTHTEMMRVIGKLRSDPKTPIAGVLLDLRGNPGGVVDQAAAVADEFLTSGPIYTMRHRGQVVEQATAHSGGAFANLPVVVLMNEWSASASELVAGALQDADHATIVGVTSFGKGVVQSIIDLPGGAGLKLTTSRYYTPNGHGVQGEGIHPDVTVEPSRKVDGGAFVFHESDYANSLPSEGSTAHDGGVVVTYEVADGGPPEWAAGREIPSDPRTTNDPVMRVGYEILVHKINRRSAAH
jgi:carboxyl-terminal processing protease